MTLAKTKVKQPPGTPSKSFSVDWSRLDLNVKAIDDKWSRGEAQASVPKTLGLLALADLAEICTNLKIAVLGADRKDDLLAKILGVVPRLDLYRLQRFYRGKAHAVDEYVQISSDSLCVDLVERRSTPFPALVALALVSTEHLINIEIVARWISYLGGTEYHASAPLTPARVAFSKGDLDQLTAALQAREKETGVSAVVDKPYVIGEHVFVAIHRQVGDRVLQEIDGRRRSKPATLAMIHLENGTDHVEARNTTGLDETLSGWLQKKLGPLVPSAKKPFEDFDETVFKKALLTPLSAIDETRLAVSRLRARTSIAAGRAEIQLSSPDGRSDIRAALRELVEISPIMRLTEPADIESLDLVYKGRTVTVAVELDTESLKCKAVPRESRLTDVQRTEFAQQFETSTGFPLRRLIGRGAIPINRWWVYDELLSGRLDSSLDGGSRKYLAELKGIGVAIERSCFAWRCGANHNDVTDDKPDRCIHCNAEIQEVHEDKRIEPMQGPLRDLILGSLDSIEGVAVSDKTSTRTIDGRKYELAVLNVKGQHCYVHITSESIAKSFLNFFVLSQAPLLIVRIGHEAVSSLLTNDIFRELTAGVILQASVGNAGVPTAPAQLKRAVEDQREAAWELRERAGRQSRTRLVERLGTTPSPGYATPFEDDVFNILPWWTDIAEKWGKETYGAAVPEGIAGWRVGEGTPPPGHVMAWDCKWSDSDKGYDLNASEKRKAQTYIGKIRSQHEIKSYSSDLSLYAFVSNNFRVSQLEGVAKSCKDGNPTWKGQVSFIDADAILELFILRLNHGSDLLQRMTLLREQLTAKLLGKPYDVFTRISRDDIKALIDGVLGSQPESAPFDSRTLRARLTASA